MAMNPLPRAFALMRRGDSPAHPAAGLGIALLLAAIFTFTLMDTVAKHLTQTYPPAQVIWARYAGNMLIVLLFLRGAAIPALRSRQPLVQLGRAVTQLASIVLFFFALRHIGLAEATAIMDLNPVLITLMAALFLGERIGPRRILGIVAAMIGAFIIIRPGLGVFQPAALLPLIGAFTYAAGAVLTRVARFDSVQTSILWGIGIGTLATTAVLPFVWQPIAAGDIWAFVLIGALGTVSQAMLIRAFMLAEASAIAPFGYTGLVWAGIWGWLFFGEVPDGWTVLGAAIIVGAGLYIWAREARAARRG